VPVTDRGLLGDRAWALVDAASRKIGSAKNVKKLGELLQCRARFTSPPESIASSRSDGSASDTGAPAVRITLPDGTVIDSGHPDSESALNTAFGPGVSLVSVAPDGLRLEFAAGTLGGKYADLTEIAVAGSAPSGTLFDYAAVHIITTSTLRALEKEYPEGRFAVQRFRPNIVIDCGDATGFVENDWTGGTLTIGSDVTLKVSIPTPRCVMTTLPQADLPADPRILKTATALNRRDLGDLGHLPCVGVYADIVRTGSLRRGDPVVISH